MFLCCQNPARRRLAQIALGLFVVLAVNAYKPLSAADGPLRLTTDGRIKRDALFSADGDSLFYTLLETEDRLRIMRMSMEDGSVSPLHKDVTKSEFEPSFSTEGDVYSYVESRGNLFLALVIRDSRSESSTDVFPGSGFSGMRSPAVAPDSSRVLYCFPESGHQHIYSVNLAGEDRRQLTDGGGINNWPHFSRDGRQVCFGSTRDENYEIYLMRSDGTAVRRLTEHPAQDIRPMLAPDGRRIAFTSARDGNYEIYVINVDGSGLRRVTDHAERDDFCAWHPDSRRLVMVSERQGRHDLYLVDAGF